MAEPSNSPWTLKGAAIELRIRLTPRGGRDSVDGVTQTPAGPALKARVTAVPEDGAANDALIALIAKEVGIPRRDVALTAGHKSRVKLLVLTGNPAEIQSRLHAVLAKVDIKDEPQPAPIK